MLLELVVALVSSSFMFAWLSVQDYPNFWRIFFLSASLICLIACFGMLSGLLYGGVIEREVLTYYLGV